MSSAYQRLFLLLILSMNNTPGSACSHVLRMILFQSIRASTVLYTRPSNTRSNSSSFLTAHMNWSVTVTLMLKLVSLPFCCLHVINSSISGWSTLNTPIIAPLRCPADLIVSHIASHTPMKEIGPEEVEPRERIKSPLGRSVEKSKPSPPPSRMVSAASDRACIIPSIESSIVPLA